jgi:predicted secreted Zn-dependent protease
MVAVIAGVLCGWFATPARAQEKGWWEGLDDLGSGLHVVEIDSLYPVGGFTHDDIYRDMQRNGPGTDEIGVRLGVHLSQWRWGFQYNMSPGERCRLVEATVLLRSSIVLPEWTNVSTAPDEIAAGWRPFLRALRAHEEGHRSRAKAQGVFLWQSLLGLESDDCDELQRIVKETADRVIGEGREAQLAYDRDTGHGLTQGAVWPPR